MEVAAPSDLGGEHSTGEVPQDQRQSLLLRASLQHLNAVSWLALLRQNLDSRTLLQCACAPASKQDASRLRCCIRHAGAGERQGREGRCCGAEGSHLQSAIAPAAGLLSLGCSCDRRQLPARHQGRLPDNFLTGPGCLTAYVRELDIPALVEC